MLHLRINVRNAMGVCEWRGHTMDALYHDLGTSRILEGRRACRGLTERWLEIGLWSLAALLLQPGLDADASDLAYVR